MITGAKEQGQSILEFLILLPMLVGITMILIRINTAIQISIVNQQYARAQTLFLAYNSAFYPELSKHDRLISNSTNQMIVGVSDNSEGSNQSGQTSYVPRATVQLVARTPRIVAPNQPQEEPTTRAKVRIRSTVTLCTPVISLSSGNGTGHAILAVTPRLRPPFDAVGSSTLSEGSRFNYCGSPIQYAP